MQKKAWKGKVDGGHTNYKQSQRGDTETPKEEMWPKLEWKASVGGRVHLRSHRKGKKATEAKADRSGKGRGDPKRAQNSACELADG